MKETNPDRFKTRKEALNWLMTQGYKISQGKFYTDCTNGQKITVHRDGTVSKWEVFEYARNELKTGTGSGTGSGLAAEQMRKIRAEADMKELQFQIETRKQDKLWLHADEAWATLAALIGTLRDAISHQLDSGKNKIVEAAGGSHDQGPEVFEFCESLINKAFNEVADSPLDVTFEREIENEPNQEEPVRD